MDHTAWCRRAVQVMTEAVKVLEAVSSKFDVPMQFDHALVGGAAYDVHNEHFPVCERHYRPACSQRCIALSQGLRQRGTRLPRRR